MKLFSLLTSFLLLCASVESAHSDPSHTQLDAIIESVQDAYNVNKLHAAKTIRLEEDVRMEYTSHDFGPDFHDLISQRRHHVLDLKNKKGSTEYLTFLGSNNYHGRSILKDGKALFIDYGNGTFQPQDDSDFIAQYGGVIRASDVLLAYELVMNKSQASYNGTAMWLGRDYHKISLDFPNSPPLTIFVETKTGYIGKMVRTLSNDLVVSYTFDNHKIQNGITIATEHSVFAGRNPLYFIFNRKVVINNRKDRRAFKIDKNIAQEPTRVDQSTMTVEKISSNTHHVGQGEAYTTFVKAPSGIIALGTFAGFADRLAAYRKQTGVLTKLEYAVVVDHHQEATAGVEAAVAEGAILLISEDSQFKIDALFEGANNIPKTKIIVDSLKISNLNIVSVPTAHASQVLIAYDIDQSFLYQHMHYASPYVNTRSYAKHSAVSLYEAIKPLGITPKVLLSGASLKPEAWSDFILAVENFNPTQCHHKRPICE